MSVLSSEYIHQLCKEEGFASSGISPVKQSRYEQHFLDWIDEGKQGEMDWLRKNVNVRMNAAHLLEGARSVICVLDRYNNASAYNHEGRGGWIARYAQGKDYHKQLKKRLHRICDALTECSTESFRACVDTAPLLEREVASEAGLGAIGKNTLLIEQGIGSWFFVGAIVTTAKLLPSEPNQQNPCQSCTKCIDACPTDAITPFSVDATKCISYLTIEHRTEIDPSFHQQMGRWLFGCDVCQEVCPHNQETLKSNQHASHSEYVSDRNSFDVLDVLKWTEEDRRRELAGSAMKRAKLHMFKRNALIVAGNILQNESDEELMQAVTALSQDEDVDSVVRNTAKTVLERVRS